MGVNRYKPHVWVVPEDDACRQLANGFVLHPSLDAIPIDIKPAAGGWPKVLTKLSREYIIGLRDYALRHLVLLIDFDNNVEERTKHFREQFPKDLYGRIYLLGSRSAPEPLRRDFGQSFEKIGQLLADDCANKTNASWGNELLRHNIPELDRLTTSVRNILFPDC